MTDVEKERINRLYEALEARQRAKPPTIRELPTEERKAYMAELQRRTRAKAKAAAEDGRVEARTKTIRDALADAALIILASGAPGADAIEKLVGIAFAGRPGVAGTVRAKARAGAIRPKLLTPDVLKAATSKSALAILDRAPDVAPDPGDEIIS
ncbi:hypothetical protein [Bosea sp. 47.2.35]|uniref:hypothetical protein n=1 Tax=Bosea sp. 47.2.35 TaxID=2969304 RepID=UPI00214F7E17|nr:hypothetical protein [Bosea sp. 47.2.35]MCR4521679.1 hypothetical protein [Bosea sp. 47.2.35]